MMSADLRDPRFFFVLGLFAVGLACVGILDGASLQAAEPASPDAAAESTAPDWTPPPYPRVSLSTWYEVDPNWPDKSEDMPWAATPGIAVDQKDQVWVFTRAAPPVRVYTAAGKLVRSFGTDLIGSKPDGTLGSHQIRFDSQGHVWLVDAVDHVVLQVTTEGKLLKTLGTRGELGCDESHFNKPTDVAITPDGQVFVADGYGNSRVVHFDARGRFVKAWGKLGTAPGEFNLPHSIALDSKGRVYVAGRNNTRIQVFDPSGKLLDVWQNRLVPWSFCMTENDELWVSGSSPMRWREEDKVLGCPPKDQLVMRFDTAGKLLQLWTFPKGIDEEEKPGELNWFHGIAVDSQGNLYATDIIGQRAQKFVRKN